MIENIPKYVIRVTAHLREKYSEFAKYESTLFNAVMNRSMGRSVTNQDGDDEEEIAEQCYQQNIDEILRKLLLLLEMLGLHESRIRIMENLQKLKEEGNGQYKVEFVPFYDYFECSATRQLLETLEFLEHACDATVEQRDGAADEKKQTKHRLERILKGTAHWVEKIKSLGDSDVTKEKHVHDMIRVILESNFSNDYKDRPEVPNTLKNYEPDGGIISINTAIEYKFVDSREKLNTAVDGIYTDIKAYKGAGENHWKRFCAVIYMTEPFVEPARIEEEIRKQGTPSWIPFVVVGHGGKRKEPTKKKT